MSPVKVSKSKVAVKVEMELGDRYFINGTACVVRFVNQGKAWICPIVDCPDDIMVARHIAYAVIEKGIAKIL